MPEHHDPTPSERDPIIDELRMQRPVATPPESVRAAHRAALDSAIDKTAARSGASWKPRRRLVVSVAASVAIIAGVVVAANTGRDTPDSDLVAGEADTADPSSEQPADPADDALTSAACGGPLPFHVPVGDGYSGPISGPAPGAEPASTDDQLVAHWTKDGSSVEVRWPAEADPENPGSDSVTYHELRDTRIIDKMIEDPPTQIQIAVESLVAADLSIGMMSYSDGANPARSESYVDSAQAGADRTYTVAVAVYEAERAITDRTQIADPNEYAEQIWGEGMCGAVQLTVRSDTGGGILAEAEQFYNDLISPGGPLVPEVEEQPLVANRAEAAELQPVTPCQVPEGIDQEPTASTPIESEAIYPTADEALAAHVEKEVVVTEDGPFGKPVTTPTGPIAGFTAISLPDGTIAYQFPPDIVAYFVASPVDGGWSITRYMGPTC